MVGSCCKKLIVIHYRGRTFKMDRSIRVLRSIPEHRVPVKNPEVKSPNVA